MSQSDLPAENQGQERGQFPALPDGVSAELVVQRQYVEVRSVYPVDEIERLEKLYPGSTEQMWEAERENRQIVFRQQNIEASRTKALSRNSSLGIVANALVSLLALLAASYALRLGHPWVALGIAAIGVTPALTPYLVGILWGKPNDEAEGP